MRTVSGWATIGMNESARAFEPNFFYPNLKSAMRGVKYCENFSRKRGDESPDFRLVAATANVCSLTQRTYRGFVKNAVENSFVLIFAVITAVLLVAAGLIALFNASAALHTVYFASVPATAFCIAFFGGGGTEIEDKYINVKVQTVHYTCRDVLV